MNTGKTLFAQLMDFLPWTTFTRIVDRYGGEFPTVYGASETIRATIVLFIKPPILSGRQGRDGCGQTLKGRYPGRRKRRRIVGVEVAQSDLSGVVPEPAKALAGGTLLRQRIAVPAGT